MRGKQQTEESKYIQQHLANERTYLAWIRSAVAIMGVGFLVATLHFNTGMNQAMDQMTAIFISLITLLIAVMTIIFSTISYFRTRKMINTQTFRSSVSMILICTSIMLLVGIALFVYYFMLMD
ncbi:hypothetical protein AB990_08025 [Alkalihalobacillus pseudalcaliphilus]|nr:hypothetical protein AB990_08025 [Alkalihalobacillus pseudalcaliphilus]